MRKLRPVFCLLFLLFTITLSFAQIDACLVDIESNKTVYIPEMYKNYNLDLDKPTILISWSGKWCYPCIQLIERYAKCDTSMFNLITVNVDKPSEYQEILKQGHHKNWNHGLNFHINVGEGYKKFGSIFNTGSAPLYIYSEFGRMKEILVSYELYPYLLVLQGHIPDIKFLWNSWRDLNSMAWYYYQNEREVEKLKEAITWIRRSIELNNNYHNTDTYAALLYKTGDYTQALKVAKEAITIAKANNEKYESTNELIQTIIDAL